MIGAIEKPLIFRTLATPAAALQCTGPNKLVLVTLLTFRRGTGCDVVWPSQGQLCEITGMSGGGVQRSLDRLCELGHITLHEGSNRKCKRYQINVEHILQAIRAGEAGAVTA